MPIEWHLRRRADYRSAPWKNGGGITHEVLRAPPDTPPFDWRVSVARIDRDGPFSDFQGYTRHMALLAGNGVRLRHAGGTRELRRPGDLIEFDGGEAMECELLNGSCTDLNLMVARSLPATARMLTVTAPVTLAPPADQSAFLFALAPLQVASHGTATVQLGPWDSLSWAGGGSCLVSLAPQASAAPSVVFFATIGHGRQSTAARHSL